VLERAGLEGRACECYAVVKKEVGRLLSDVRYRQDLPDPAIAGRDVSGPMGFPATVGASFLAT
jgi:hypothetical protein